MGTDEQGQPIVLKDPKAKELHPLVWEIFCNNDSSKNFIATGECEHTSGGFLF